MVGSAARLHQEQVYDGARGNASGDAAGGVTCPSMARSTMLRLQRYQLEMFFYETRPDKAVRLFKNI